MLPLFGAIIDIYKMPFALTRWRRPRIGDGGGDSMSEAGPTVQGPGN